MSSLCSGRGGVAGGAGSGGSGSSRVELPSTISRTGMATPNHEASSASTSLSKPSQARRCGSLGRLITATPSSTATNLPEENRARTLMGRRSSNSSLQAPSRSFRVGVPIRSLSPLDMASIRAGPVQSSQALRQGTRTGCLRRERAGCLWPGSSPQRAD